MINPNSKHTIHLQIRPPQSWDRQPRTKDRRYPRVHHQLRVGRDDQAGRAEAPEVGGHRENQRHLGWRTDQWTDMVNIGFLPDRLWHVRIKVSSTNLWEDINWWRYLLLLQTCFEGQTTSWCIFFNFYKTGYPNVDVSCTGPFPSVRIPWNWSYPIMSHFSQELTHYAFTW